MFLKFSKNFQMFFIWGVIESLLLSGSLLAATIQVTNTDGGSSTGSLGVAIQQAQDGDIVDCSPIAGQTIEC